MTTYKYWYIAFPATALLWILFKCCYPYADFFTDSYTYIQAAADHSAISYRPIGYSLFLRLVHLIWRSDTFLVTVQFLLVQSSCWLLFGIVCRSYAPGPVVQSVIAALLVLNPLVYYISNFVSSDALFIALSLFWLASLMQSMRSPAWRGTVIQWVLLALIFYTRYVALFYPLVAAICYCWLRRAWWFRLTAMAGSVVIVAAGVFWTRELTRVETGTATFSAFSGWQMANNALHIYPWLPVDSAGLPSATLPLAGYVDRYFMRVDPQWRQHPIGSTTTYMWAGSSPLHVYLNEYRRPHSGLRHDSTQLSYFNAWNGVAPVFSEYGYSLMRRHPLAFSRYYLWPSAESFFLSPLDVFAAYLDGKKEIDQVAVDWFGYRTTRPRVYSATLQGRICAPFPWLSFLFTVAFGAMAGFFLPSRELREQNPGFTGCLRVAAVYLGVNMCFNIFASPSVYRYQVLPLLLLFIFTCCGGSILWTFFVSYGKQRGHVRSIPH